MLCGLAGWHLSFQSRAWAFQTLEMGMGVGVQLLTRSTRRIVQTRARGAVLKKVTGIDLKIGLGIAWSKDAPAAAPDDIIDIARTLGRPHRSELRYQRLG